MKGKPIMGWKIVRDNDGTVVPPLGVSGQWRPSATPLAGLTRKLLEEAGEFVEHQDPAELYDLRDVTEELIHRLDPTGQAARQHEKKAEQRGMFTRGLEWNPVPRRSAHLDST
jgi:hypothetical protein